MTINADDSGLIEPGTPFRDIAPTITLPEGTTTLDLLGRGEVP